MKPSFIVGMVTGYVLGSRAGRERYEDIVAIARRVAGSQTIQATAGVLQAQVYELTGRVRTKAGGGSTDAPARSHRPLSSTVTSNGHSRS